MTKIAKLHKALHKELVGTFLSLEESYGELTLECEVGQAKSLLNTLKANPVFSFDQLIDLCAVDFLKYGVYDWETNESTESGFSRGVERQETKAFHTEKPRFAVVYHLLSTTNNVRIRIKVYIEEGQAVVPSVHDIWKGANWFEREAYDLYGILFEGHPDLRRILTDYGFVGHPFRKDFPLSGYVEMRYDAKLEKVIYEPVDIQPRIGVPKVIRDDNRYVESRGGDA